VGSLWVKPRSGLRRIVTTEGAQGLRHAIGHRCVVYFEFTYELLSCFEPPLVDKQVKCPSDGIGGPMARHEFGTAGFHRMLTRKASRCKEPHGRKSLRKRSRLIRRQSWQDLGPQNIRGLPRPLSPGNDFDGPICIVLEVSRDPWFAWRDEPECS